MICNNCSAKYDDELKACPECGAEIKDGSVEAEEKADAPCEEKAAEAEPCESETAEDADAEAQETESKAKTEEEEKEAGEEQADEKLSKEKQIEPVTPRAPVKPERLENPKPQLRKVGKTRKEMIKEKKRQKVASAIIIVIMCLVALLAAALSVLNITTDIFDNDGASEKVVAGIGFTAQEEKELEELLAKSFSVSRKQYNKAGVTAEQFLENIIPGDEGNIYSRINGVNEKLQSEADPAERFADENGNYAYYKLEQSKVDKVLELFALESYRGENCRNYYYCDGFYYFAAGEGKATPAVSAEVVKSRRVLDGSYYVEGYFYAEKQGETVKTDNYHFVVEMTKNADTGENVYVIKKVSEKPIFGSDGKLVDSAENAERKKEVIEGYTDDGKLFCVYTLDFPVLEGKGEGYKNLNEFFKNAVSVYELKAKSAQQSYAEFKQNGGDESKLPVVENLVASVVFEDEKNLSFKAEISRYMPVSGDAGIYKRSVEAYTFDKASGNFVSKDDVLGKNYMLLGEILYRIHGGYEYENLLPKENEEEETESYDDVPADREGIGAKIYESAWSYTENGVTFFYLNDMGYVTEVTIPLEVAKKLK